MKLYDVPNNTMIKLTDDLATPPGTPVLKKGEIIRFGHIDGMYSYCKDSNGNTVHLVSWAEVEMVASTN